MKYLITSIFILTACLPLHGNEPAPVHMDYVKFSGKLPSPYNTIDVEIELDHTTHSPKLFNIFIDDYPIKIEKKDFSKLQALVLNSLAFSQSFERYGSGIEHSNDTLFLEIEFGEEYRIDWEFKGKKEYKWGRDKVILDLLEKNQAAIVYIRKLSKYSSPI